MAIRVPKFNPWWLMCWGLKLAIIASTVWLIYVGLYAWAFNAGLVSVLVVLPNIIAYKKRAKIPWPFDLLISSAMAVHILGFSLKLYPTIPHYDVLAHFVSSAFIGLLMFCIFMVLHYHTDKIRLTPRLLATIIIISTMAIGVIWELYEWTNDVVLFAGSPHEQWSVADTMKDLIVNMIGGTFVAIVGNLWIRYTPKYKLKDIFNYPTLAKWLKNRL